MNEKSFFGCLDMRNAKFQGSIRNSQPHGPGIVLNLDYSLIISTWKNEVPEGSSLVVFPSRNYYYGEIRNNSPEGLGCYATFKGDSFFMRFQNGNLQKIAYLKGKELITEVLVTQPKYKIGKSVSLRDKQVNKWQVISRILDMEVPSYFKSLRYYSRDRLSVEAKQTIQVSQSSGHFFIGFKNTPSLGIKIDQFQQIKQIGLFEKFPRNIDFGRKYIDTLSYGYKVQEGQFSQQQKTFSFEGERTPETLRLTQEYFKRGTNFRNTFFKFNSVDILYQSLEGYIKKISHLSIFEYGQKIIEGDQQEQNFTQNKKYTVEEIKKQIYAAVERRNKGRKTERFSPISRQSYQATPIQDFKEVGYQNNDGIKSSPTKQYIYTQKPKRQLRSSRRNSNEKLKEFTLYEKQSKDGYYPMAEENFKKIEERVVRKLTKQRAERRAIEERVNIIAEANRLKYAEENIIAQRQEEVLSRRKIYNPVKMSPSPIKRVYKPNAEPTIYAPLGRDRSYNRLNHEERLSLNGEESEYPHYQKYKNRNRTPTKTVEYNEIREENRTPNKYGVRDRLTSIGKENGGVQKREVFARPRRSYRYL